MQISFLYKAQMAFLCALFLFLTASKTTAEESMTSGPFSFLAISDMPYSPKEDYILTQRTRPAIEASPLPFVIFMGDFKNSTLPCSAALLTERRNQIMALHPGRVFYTPGDNDWTDCDRTQMIQRFSELDRLDLLRRLFYDTPMALPPEWLYARQALFPENMRWVYKNTLFATVHLVSTNNGREEILLSDVSLALTLTDARDRANYVWLSQAFAEAGKIGADAVVIATQADVTHSKYKQRCTETLRQECDAFADFNLHLRYLSAQFKKPVLLMHGDTFPYCLDKEFGGASAPNLWRFNSTGDYGLTDAAVITVNSANRSTPFSFTSLTERTPPAPNC
ncbi:MAG: hypothetical protein CMN56_15925 [Sneathiella sp.]|uniref:hypothetical protein n=1 Tax=Sneathiella sp. TaxID=1964365 RepID=UPI000C4CB91D|nr:hypothetical protein [Sneathiella sp.]MAZ04623.1 hypothetical protein [Sneathiella sp.]